MSGRSTLAPYRWPWILGLATLLVLTACGDQASDDPEQPQATESDSEESEELGPAEEEAEASSYPERDIRFIIPYDPGGSTDPIGREFASRLSDTLGVNVNVENIGGGSGSVGTSAMVTSDPDGYTMGLTTSGAIAGQPLVNDTLDYTQTEGYDLINRLGGQAYALVVDADSEWETLEDFIAEAESRPGELSVSTPGPDNPGDLVMQQWNAELGGLIDPIPFDGGGAALTALLGGQVDANIGATGTIPGQIEAGEIRALALFNPERFDSLPDLPAITEFGYEAAIGTWHYIGLPPGVPDDIVAILEEASEEILFSDEWREFMSNQNQDAEPLGREEAIEHLHSVGAMKAEVYADLEG